MSRLLINHAAVIGPDKVLPDHAVLIIERVIAAVRPSADMSPGSAEQVVDAGGAYLAPGFLDLHIHGMHRYMVDHGPDDLAALCALLPRYGVTGFLPTVSPRPKGEDAAFLRTLAAVRPKGAAILGFHLEGPFLSILGALPREAIGKADPERVRSLIAAATPHRAIFSVSPEFEGIGGLLPLMRENRTPVFMTHTAADARQTRAAIEGGVTHATHFYDVFPSPPETDPGVRPSGAVEAVLADPRASVDFILDGEHVDPVAVKAALAAKGPDRVALITDANLGAGLPPARHRSTVGHEIEIVREGGPARTVGHTPVPGVLAGSGLTMDRALRNALRLLGVDLPQAVRMVSTNPARVLGIERRHGQIRAGFDADLVLLDPSLHVLRTWVNAESVYQRAEPQPADDDSTPPANDR